MKTKALRVAANPAATSLLKFLSAAAACLCVAATPAAAQTFLFDFGAPANTTEHGAAPEDPINYWNNIPEALGGSPTGLLTNIVTAANAPSTMGLAIISRFNASNGNGTTASTLYPSEATRDSLFGNTEVFNTLVNIFPSFKLTGLDPAAAYDFTFYASRTGAVDNRETAYTVAGSNNGSASLNAANNTNGVATAAAISPTASGEITISLAPTANNNNGNHFTYLGVMQVSAVPPQTPLGFTLEPINTRVVELSPVTFTAAVTGSAPHFVQWFSNGISISGASQFSYTIPSASLDMDGSIFSVNVSNLAYSVTSSNAVLRVVNDLVPPQVASYSSVDGITVNVCYNEAVTVQSGAETFNYVFDGGTLPVTASLSPDGKCATLTMSEKLSSPFTLEIDGIYDLSGNKIAPTNFSVVIPDPETQMVLIDFGGNSTTERGAAPADDPIRYWNNLSATTGQSDTGVQNALVTTQNLVTAISLSMVSRFNGLNENGTVAASPFPTDATRDSLFGNTEIFSGLANIFPIFKLTGLNPSRSYDLMFYASRTAVADVRETQYTVDGANRSVVFLNAANNVANTVTASNILPTAAGEITISLAPGPNNNNGNHFTYLGILGITPGPLTAFFLAPTISDGNILLQWNGAGQLQSAPAVTGPWTTITPIFPNSHLDPIVAGANRFYRILVQ